MSPPDLYSASLMVASVAAAESAASAVAASPSRALQNLDFFQSYCVKEGQTFLQCFSQLADPGACSDCHLSFIGKDTALLGTSCHAQCNADHDGTGEAFVRCNDLGYNMVTCVNDKIWGYHCREQFDALRNCRGEDCDEESMAFERCLVEGTKVLRGQSITECDEKAEVFNTCLDASNLPDSEQESCKRCHSDLGFGFRDSSCSCPSCDSEGYGVSSCIKSAVQCPDLVRKDINCNERQFLCTPTTCDEYDEGDTPPTSANATDGQESVGWDTYNWTNSNTSNTSNVPFIDWDSLRERLDEAKGVAASIHDNEDTSGTYRSSLDPFSLLMSAIVISLALR